MHESSKAAFFRVEGTLVRQGALRLNAYLAANGQGFTERLMRMSQMAIAAPAARLLGSADGALGSRISVLPLRGMSQDRIEVLASEYFEDTLRNAILPEGLALVKRVQSEGFQTVFLAETIAPVADRLQTHLQLDGPWVSNQLEVRHGEATGALQDPVLSGHSLLTWVQAWSAEHGVDLRECRAYATHAGDSSLLGSVGEPCAVNPDPLLRRTARDAHWPILDLGRGGQA
jgi:phosphoserine phosphatase